MPVKNGQAYIAEAIESIQAQTHNNWELIIVDDGSTDQTTSIVNTYMADNRIKLLSNAGAHGVANAINFGLQSATGDYFARLDSDDAWVDKTKLEQQVGFMKNNPSVVIVGTEGFAGSNRNEISYYYRYPTSDEEIRNRILLRNLFLSSSILVRLSAIKEIAGYHSADVLAEDYGLVLRLGKIGQFANLPIQAVYYRLNELSITATKYNQQVAWAKTVVANLGQAYPGYRLALLKWRIHSFFSGFMKPQFLAIIKRWMNRIRF